MTHNVARNRAFGILGFCFVYLLIYDILVAFVTLRTLVSVLYNPTHGHL